MALNYHVMGNIANNARYVPILALVPIIVLLGIIFKDRLSGFSVNLLAAVCGVIIGIGILFLVCSRRATHG